MDLYDISKYTDDELFTLLDLDNPSDRVLEAKIIQMINKYSLIANDSGKQLTKLFKNIYNHFFSPPSDEEDEAEEEEEEENEYENEKKSLTEGYINFSGTSGLPNSIDNGAGNIEYSGPTNVTPSASITPDKNVNIPSVTLSSGNVLQGDTTTYNTPQTQNSKDSTVVNVVDYKKSTLNPILKQTVKRIISIDSQYRTNKQGLSTQFTFNLSEPLKDVLALRLYSVQIPYTWYTISNNYGANFFYLKGNVPGIDTGNFDYKIEISSGNYSPTDLAATVNTSIINLKNTYTDVSFGSFGVSYKSATSLTTLTVDYQNIFNETNYRMDFQNWSSPIEVDEFNNQIRYTGNTTLAAFLGFNYPSYIPNIIYGNRIFGLTISTIFNDLNSSTYVLDNSNNYFNIIQYTGPDEYIYGVTPIVNTIKITLYTLNTNNTYSNIPMVGNFSRNTIFNSINNSLQNNPYLLNSSSITREDISTNIQDSQKSFFKMQIYLNKSTTISLPNLKIAVIFENESYNNNPIWTDNNIISCFSFKNQINELNNILGETNSLQSNYTIKSNPYFILKCITPGYINPNTINDPTKSNNLPENIDPSLNYTVYKDMSYNSPNNVNYNWNDYKIVVSNSNTLGGYSYLQYLDAINLGIKATSDAVDNKIFSTASINNDIIQNKVFFRFDINISFNESEYILDLSGSDLNLFYGIGGDNPIFYLNDSNVIEGNYIELPSSFKINQTNKNIATIKSNPTSTHAYANDWNIESISQLDNAQNLDSFISYINTSFESFTDVSFSYPLQNTSISYSININTNPITIKFILTVRVYKTLTENNFQLIFYDLLANDDGWDDSPLNTNNSWNYNLKMSQQSYNLLDYKPIGPDGIPTQSFSDIYGNNKIAGYTMTLRNDIYINFRALTNGISTSTQIYNTSLDASFNYNDIQIKIPASQDENFQYTRQDLFNIINAAFQANPLTVGSSISTYTIINNNGVSIDYIKIRPNINKIYTPKDYTISFYDPFSFVKCYAGATSVQNTTWDSTLGWILGFRLYTGYLLSNYITDTTSNKAVIIGDTATTTSLYNYFLVVLDDYTQSHLNDGLVTLTNQENNIPLPSYAARSNVQCVTATNSQSNGNQLTNNQLYSVNQILKSREPVQKNYSLGPFIQDIFGLIPMKVTGLANGSSYIEFGGTLQNQERTYFGPVNIHRMTIQLITDRGDLVDLNGSNWSFSLICEQLYSQQNT